MAADEIAAAAAAAQAAAAQLRAETDAYRAHQIEYPTLNDVTRPGAVSGLTGWLMDRPDLYGSNAGLPTFGSLTGAAGLFGQVGGVDQFGNVIPGSLDPRLAALGYEAGQKTLPGRQLDLQGDQQRAAERQWALQFGAGQSNADRDYAAQQQAALQAQVNKDTSMALEMGVDPKVVVNGAVMPEFLREHSQWARQYMQANNGKLPDYTELVKALAPFGQVPEDYNRGQPFPNQVPAAAPGILFNPQTGWTDTVTGQNLDAQKVGQVAADRWERAVPMRTGPNGEALFSLPAGASMVGATVGPNGQVSLPSLGQGGQPTPQPTATGGGVRPTPEAGDPRMQAQGQMTGGVPGGMTGGVPGAVAPAGAPAGLGTGPTAQGGGMVYQGAAIGQPAGSATAAIGQGGATSLAQRQLIESGRGTDLQNAQVTNQQRIAEKQVEYQNAIASGNLELANRAQTELTALNNAKLELDRQSAAFQQGIAAGGLTGSYTDAQGNVVSTLDKQRMEQQGQQFGQTLTEQQRQYDTTLGYNTGVQTGTLGGSDTLDKGNLMGQFNGMSTLAGQELYGGSAGVAGGVSLAAGQALGRIGGDRTLAAQELGGYTDTGAATLARQGQEADTGIRTADLMARLQGPQNAFAQQAAINGLNQAGLSNAVDAIAGRRSLPGVQGQQAPAQGASLQTVQQQLRGGVPTFGAQAPVTDINAYASALPSLNKVSGREYAKMGGATQQFLGSAYRGAGLINDQNELDAAAKKALPAFSRAGVPRFGRAA